MLYCTVLYCTVLYCVRLGAMMTAEYVLELTNVFHSGQVEPGTCLQKLIGSVRTGVILKVGIGKYPYMFSVLIQICLDNH